MHIKSTPWPDEKTFFFKFCDSQNSQISAWKPNCFCRQAIAESYFVLYSTYSGYSIPSLNRFGLLDPMEKADLKFGKFAYENLTVLQAS